MLTSEAKRKLTAGGMFGLPMALVWITSRMIGGPESAEASQAGNLALVTLNLDDIAIASPSTEQTTAAAHVDALRELEFGPTPLHHQRVGDAPVVVEDPEDSPVPQFTVKVVMASSSGNRAIVDGKVCKVGDELGKTGWIIVAIDAQTRAVSIRDPETDRVRTGKVDGPALK